MWYKSKVFPGFKQGRTIGYPTLNLDPLVLPANLKKGVYASIVKYNGKEYKAALFFGPRTLFNETKNVLEIYVLGFSEEIYNKTVSFQIRDYIREVYNFASIELLQDQIKKDVHAIELCLNK